MALSAIILSPSRALALLLLMVGGYIVRQRYFHPLSKFPGPFLACLTAFWKCYDVYTGKSHTNDLKRHKRYGPVYRDGPNSLSVADPRCLPAIYGARSNGEFRKAMWYDVFPQPGVGQVLFVIKDHEEHKIVRRRISPLLTVKAMLQHEEGISSAVADWVDQLGKRGTVDLGVWSQYLTLDVIELVAYGDRKGFIERGEDLDGYIKIIDDGYRAIAIIAPSVFLTNLYQKLAALYRPNASYKGGFVAIDTCARNAVNDIISQGTAASNTSTFAHSLVLALQGVDPGYARSYATNELMSVHLAASHSTSIGITASLYYIAKYPSVQRKLLEEINSSEISSPVKFQEALALPYLTAVIREAIRLYPPFTSPWPRVVSDDGTGGWEILPGVFVPAGADVGVPAYVSNRDTAVFGSDAEEFRPERWLPLDGERAKEMDHMMFTFGFAGSSRVCVGRNLAQMEMCKGVVEAVRRYHLGLVDEAVRLEDVDSAFVHCIVDGLLVTFTPR